MMLGVYFLQQWFNLTDPAAEDALYGSVSMRRFIGLDPGQEAAPGETTIGRLRHLLERNNLGEALFQYFLEYPETHGIEAGKGTIAEAPSPMRLSSVRRPRRRTRTAAATPICTRHARATRGFSA